MRKMIIVMLICIVSLALLGNSKAPSKGVLLRDFPSDSLLKENLQLPANHVLNRIVFLPETPFEQEEAASIITRVNQLPRPLLTKIAENHIQLRLFVGKLTDHPTAEHLKGIVPRGYNSNKKWDDVPGIGGGKVVLVKIGHSEKGMGHGSVNLELHELAHSIDRFVFDGLRQNPIFLKIYMDERNSLFPNKSYLLTFPEEYFAEAFAMYYLNQEMRAELKIKAPKTYEFIKLLK